jgi:hypothetical protein
VHSCEHPNFPALKRTSLWPFCGSVLRTCMKYLYTSLNRESGNDGIEGLPG